MSRSPARVTSITTDAGGDSRSARSMASSPGASAMRQSPAIRRRSRSSLRVAWNPIECALVVEWLPAHWPAAQRNDMEC